MMIIFHKSANVVALKRDMFKVSFDQEVPFTDHAYGTLTPEQVEELSADVDQFCPF